jgi:hypothetical protein
MIRNNDYIDDNRNQNDDDDDDDIVFEDYENDSILQDDLAPPPQTDEEDDIIDNPVGASFEGDCVDNSGDLHYEDREVYVSNSTFEEDEEEVWYTAEGRPYVFDATSSTLSDMELTPDFIVRDINAGQGYQVEDWNDRGVTSGKYPRAVSKPARVDNAFNHEEGQGDDRSSSLLVFTVCVLCLELAAATIAVIYFEPLVECCGDSFVSELDSTTNAWNQALFGISIGYLVWVIVDFPIVVLCKEPVFLFNPMIGFLLAMHMLYVTNTTFAYTIYGLETLAMLGQSYILMQLRKNVETFIHSLFNFVMSGIVVYALIELSRQGGYCIVGGELEGVFSPSTCNVRCIDEASCNICDGNTTSCFIQFSSV